MKLIQLWLPPILWAALIFFLSGLPDLKTDLEFDFTLRKAAHVTEYFILTWLLHRACKGSFKLNAWQLSAASAAMAVLYAASDEFHQTFTRGRHGSPVDVLIDSIGILGFVIAYAIFAKYNKIN